MNTLLKALTISILFCANSALAYSPDIDTQVTVKGSSLFRSHYLSPEQSRELVGHYVMDNGQTLIMTQRQNKYYVEIAGMKPTQVFPNSSESFISQNREIELRFQVANDGNATQVLAKFVQL
ncbi:hypothetical protein [Undibacterium fentianense]|uniref:Uncharacterized protein n=1 Tax=Undibacterium fentianense TaxID=2828728 RepID=A0A941DXG8_9BURK|nr:hypothetical protein [Undibacterium fentianense]MBR7798520.1 hypothetical protein [Undibacterium fentianense]